MKINLKIFNCLNCGKENTTRFGNKKTCSLECYDAYHRKKRIEYHNNQWFGGLADKVFERDGNKCVKCGMTAEEHIKVFKKRISIHHIDGNGCNVKNPNNTMENLETLCARCHGYVDWSKCKVRNPPFSKRPHLAKEADIMIWRDRVKAMKVDEIMTVDHLMHATAARNAGNRCGYSMVTRQLRNGKCKVIRIE